MDEQKIKYLFPRASTDFYRLNALMPSAEIDLSKINEKKPRIKITIPQITFDPDKVISMPGQVLKLTIDGDPVSKQRHRFAVTAKGQKVYSPLTTKNKEEAIRWLIRAAKPELISDPYSAFSVKVKFYTKNRIRRDLDNMLKLILDACNGVVWKDDSQVEAIKANVFRGDENPRSELKIATILSPTAYKKCKICGKYFKTHPSWIDHNHCSRKCGGITAARTRCIG